MLWNIDRRKQEAAKGASRTTSLKNFPTILHATPSHHPHHVSILWAGRHHHYSTQHRHSNAPTTCKRWPMTPAKAHHIPQSLLPFSKSSSSLQSCSKLKNMGKSVVVKWFIWSQLGFVYKYLPFLTLYFIHFLVCGFFWLALEGLYMVWSRTRYWEDNVSFFWKLHCCWPVCSISICFINLYIHYSNIYT